jgi:HK97 family phage prohead protease
MPEFLFPLELKLDPARAGVIEGYASTFGGPPDSYGDVVDPGAFTATLAKHLRARTTPAMLWGHDPQQPIGKWLTLNQDAKGLKVVGQLTLGTVKGQEAMALAADGVLGLSIGYATKMSSRTPAGKRLLKAVDLHEISLHAMPSNTDARITSVKAVDGMTARDFSKFLHEAGFSRTMSTAITAVGFTKAMARRSPPGNTKTIEAIRAGAAALRSLTKEG